MTEIQSTVWPGHHITYGVDGSARTRNTSAFATAWVWSFRWDVEPFYRFDQDTLDPLRLRVGLGWVMHDLVHDEFTYAMSFTRDGPDDSLEWTENIWQLNFKVARQKGLLKHLFVEAGGE
jgi:hypothetical protein